MSGKMSRNKGATYQRDVRKFFAECGFEVFDPNRSGYDGDDMRLTEYPQFSVELKNHATMALPAWIAQAKAQAKAISPFHIPVVIHKRKGKTDVGQHYVAMEVNDFIQILKLIKSEREENE